jgi:ABC-type bacteriocin/lantibiotic exporter with double-glycine peptidase domain
VVPQTSGQSCGAAAGANVARWFGLRRSERDMASLFGTSVGTSAAQVIYGLRELGIEGQQVRADRKALARLARVPNAARAAQVRRCVPVRCPSSIEARSTRVIP